MKWLKLTAFTFFLFVSLSFLISCEPDAEQDRITDFEKSGIILSGAQENPANPSSAIGKMDVFYSKGTRTLSYTVTWSGLTDSVLLMHIHGLAPRGFNAGVVNNIVVAATPNGAVGNGIFPQKTSTGKFNFAKSGTLSATMQVDGVVIKEQDLLNGLYYINIHTNTYPGGEIRGQIVFQ